MGSPGLEEEGLGRGPESVWPWGKGAQRDSWHLSEEAEDGIQGHTAAGGGSQKGKGCLPMSLLTPKPRTCGVTQSSSAKDRRSELRLQEPAKFYSLSPSKIIACFKEGGNKRRGGKVFFKKVLFREKQHHQHDP